MKICIAEDSKSLLYTLKRLLAEDKYVVRGFSDPQEVLAQIKTEEFDLFLIDVNMPGMDGYELCRQIRKMHQQTPVIFLTVRDSIEDKIKGFDCGADDYLTKPFEPEELLVRIKSVIRRKLTEHKQVINVEDLEINVDTKQVFWKSIEIPLTLIEFQILEYLSRHKGQSVSKDRLEEIIWQDPFEISPNLVSIYIGKLRKKLDTVVGSPMIRTLRGFGYRIG